MTFATVINIVLAALCLIVVIQSMRMMRAVRQLQTLPLDKGVDQLEIATQNARAVLTELKSVLGTAMTTQHRTLVDGEALREELSVMVGIGNAVAERIVDAAAQTNKSQAKTNEKVEAKAVVEAAPKVKTESASKAATNTGSARSADRRGRSRSGSNRRAASKMMEPPVKAPTTNTVGQA